MWWLRVVSGGNSPMTFQCGQRFIAISEHGAMMEHGAQRTSANAGACQ